jgi:hypothetical protein
MELDINIVQSITSPLYSRHQVSELFAIIIVDTQPLNLRTITVALKKI